MGLWEKSKHQPSLWMIDVGVAAALALFVFCMWNPTLGIRFYQDDYWSLFLAQNPSLGLIPGAIPWAQDWRPLGAFAPFYIIRRLFGLNPYVFHLTNLLIHLLNGVLVYRLSLLLMGTREFALVAAIFYSLHLAHTRSMQWAAGIDCFLSTAWYLLAFSTYVQFRKNGHRWAYWASLIAFAAALLTKEWSVSFVAVALWYELVSGPASRRFRSRAQWKTAGVSIAGHCMLLFIYLGIRIALFTFPREGQYALHLSASLMMRNLAEYLRFAVFPVSAFESPLTPTLAGTLVALFLLMLVFSCIFRRQVMSFGLGWFVIALSPVLFISRLEPYFLAIPLAGFAIAVGALAKITVQLLPFDAIKRWAALVLAGMLVGTMLIAGAKEVRIQQEALWLVRPQRFADCTLAYLSSRWPSLAPNSLLFFRNFNAEEHYILGFGSAVNVYYNDNTIRTAFISRDNDNYSSLVNTLATPSLLEDKIVHREAVTAFCENTSSLRLQ